MTTGDAMRSNFALTPARRQFLKVSAAGMAVAGASAFFALGEVATIGAARGAGRGEGGYGPLSPVKDLRDHVARMSLPVGFSYISFGITGDKMSDGNATPKAHDGMAAFQLANGNIRLIRNHEDRNDSQTATVKGDPAKAYDTKAGGSTTSLEMHIDSKGIPSLVRDFVSINGTHTNCAGGVTQFNGGAWLTCEEITEGASAFVADSQRRPFFGKHGFAKPHGYVFQVPVNAEELVKAVPLKALGRFAHEAVAVDPDSGILYQTEDDGDSGFFRFIPEDANDLSAGGKLQMLSVSNHPNYDTRTGQTLRRALPVTWVDIDDPDPADAETNSKAVYEQGIAKGAAIFARLEGCWYSKKSVFFNATTGGDAGEGQVWEYTPTGSSSGMLRLIFESPGESVLDNPDHICVSPRGGIVLCEDGDLDSLYLRGLTKNGRIFDFAQNLESRTEWAGACFSPDGKILFVNWQGDTRGPDNDPSQLEVLGRTFAIWGPWEDGAL
jgi:secreted PhoX family phosphatase